MAELWVGREKNYGKREGRVFSQGHDAGRSSSVIKEKWFPFLTSSLIMLRMYLRVNLEMMKKNISYYHFPFVFSSLLWKFFHLCYLLLKFESRGGLSAPSHSATYLNFLNRPCLPLNLPGQCEEGVCSLQEILYSCCTCNSHKRKNNEQFVHMNFYKNAIHQCASKRADFPNSFNCTT